MRIIVGDLWEQVGWIVVPINWTVNKHGQAVMGRGVAKQCKDRHPGVEGWLGNHIRYNEPTPLHAENCLLIFLPVKYHWKDKADIGLIEEMVNSLSEAHHAGQVFLPLLGCGFGEAEPMTVITLLAKGLDDRFILVLKDDTVKSRYTSSFLPGARKDNT